MQTRNRSSIAESLALVVSSLNKRSSRQENDNINGGDDVSLGPFLTYGDTRWSGSPL